MTMIFVYGSLRKGMYNYDRYLSGRVHSIQPAYVKGALYTIKGVAYPALVDGIQLILGEMMEIADDSIMEELDELEGFRAEGHIDNEYNKVMKEIYNEQGECIATLPVYVFNMDNPKHKDVLGELITSGDYVRYMSAR